MQAVHKHGQEQGGAQVVPMVVEEVVMVEGVEVMMEAEAVIVEVVDEVVMVEMVEVVMGEVEVVMVEVEDRIHDK